MIAVEDLSVRYTDGKRTAHVVRGVDFGIEQGGAIGIVGESGSGKSTVLRCIAGLEHGWTGRILLNGEQLGRVRTRTQMQAIQMVFQDPYGSLHPRHRVGQALREPLLSMGIEASAVRIGAALDRVGLPRSFAERFPHQLSGGQRQRVAIARALMLAPATLLLDEPTSALDVSVQAEVLNLLMALREDQNLTFIFVSHDLAVVAHMCDRVFVMKDGVFVEEVTNDDLRARRVKNEYTATLLENSLL